MGMVDMDQIKPLIIDETQKGSKVPEGIDQGERWKPCSQWSKVKTVCPLQVASRNPFSDAIAGLQGRTPIGQSYLVALSVQSFAEDDRWFGRSGPLPVTKQMEHLEVFFHLQAPSTTS
jgi:hypothetical protein